MWQDAVLGHLRVLEMSESGMLAPSASGLGVWMVSIQVCKLAVAYMRGVGDDQHRHEYYAWQQRQAIRTHRQIARTLERRMSETDIDSRKLALNKDILVKL